MAGNKTLGNRWEREFCGMLAASGYWVHFISPDIRGAQPFDVIAVKDGIAHAYDCKTCAAKRFPYSRLEDNQIMAFEKWLSCGNTEPQIAVLHDGEVYIIDYSEVKQLGSVRLEERYRYENEK